MNWQIKHNAVDISDQVSRFAIDGSLERFCREATIDIADPDLYGQLDFNKIPEDPAIEILTRTDGDWVSQGLFFIERPSLAVGARSDRLQGVWGRSSTARLDAPFAPKVTKTWEQKTTFFAICDEMCDLVGLTWDPAYSDIADFVIYPYTYAADGKYPIDIIADLAELAGALVATDRLGHLCIRQIDYDPSAADITVTDAQIAEIEEQPEWPTFANRVRITPTGGLASYAVRLNIPDPCIPADGTSRTKLYTHVKDPEGMPINGLIVNWTIASTTAALLAAATNTQEIAFYNEQQRSDDFYRVTVDFPPSSVDGVYAYSDTARTTNLAAGGYTIEGNTIVLTDKLAYCDQTLLISYRADGIAVNYLQAGNEAEDVTVTADVEGQSDSGTVYIDNPCQCPPVIRLTAAPTSIVIAEVARLLVYVEESGPVTSGRMVFMAETSASRHGALNWTRTRLGWVAITREKTAAVNEIAGVTQCELAMYPASVTGVYVADENGQPTGGNLYASHAGKVVDLTSSVPTGTTLVANYTAVGAALNLFAATALGTARIQAYILTTSEAGAEASATVQVIDNSVITDDFPEDWSESEDDGEYGGVGGEDIDFDSDATLCRQDDGETVQCQEGERCCWNGFDFGCFPEEECDKAVYNPCVSENVSGDPSESNLDGRFATPLFFGCDCEEICQKEIDNFGTTQGYDGGSGRTLSEIVIEDYEYPEGSPEYWEQLDTLTTEALAGCIYHCKGCTVGEPMTWDEENSPETIVAGGSIGVFVKDGTGPFTWAVSGTGYSLDNVETSEGQNQLTCASGTCGVDFDAVASITVTDACGVEVTAKIRNTAGSWEWVSDSDDTCFNMQGCDATCPSTYSGLGYCDEINGDTKKEYTYHWYACYHPSLSQCPGCKCEDMGFPPCSSAQGGECHAYKYSTYEWSCP